jgi:type IV secretory pathway VirB2 component (pilin)
MSVSAMAVPVRNFHILSAVIAAAAIGLAYVAFRAATVGKTDSDTMLRSLCRAIGGAFIGLIAVIVIRLMFGTETHGLLAHALGKSASTFTTFQLMIASALLGFGGGFVVRMPPVRNQEP